MAVQAAAAICLLFGVWAFGAAPACGQAEMSPGPGGVPAEAAASGEESVSEISLSDLATRGQLFVVLAAVLAMAVYASVRFSSLKSQMNELRKDVYEFDENLTGIGYEQFSRQSLFRSTEEGLPILPGLSFPGPDVLFLGCSGGLAVPGINELRGNWRVNVLLNVIHTVLEEPEQKAVLVSRRFGTEQIGWGLLSLEAGADFASLDEVRKAEIAGSPKLLSWEKSLFCFCGWETDTAHLYKTCRRAAEPDAELTIVLDGLEFMRGCLSEQEAGGPVRKDGSADLAELAGKLRSLASRCHAGIVVLIDSDSPAWKKRAVWAGNWAEVRVCEGHPNRAEADGCWNDRAGRRAISCQWNLSAENGALEKL